MNFGKLSQDWPEVELVNKSSMISSSFLILGNWWYVKENELPIAKGMSCQFGHRLPLVG